MIDYTAAAATYDNTRTHSDAVIDRLHARVPLGPAVTVLDFGCGTGNYLARILERHGCGCFGVEPSDEMRARAQLKSDRLRLVRGDHLAIPFPTDTFDLCYMTDVIHHVPDLPALFRELARVLKPRGLLCVVTESHPQIDARFYNRYFPSLASNEKRRYPDIGLITTRAHAAGLLDAGQEVLPSPPRQVTDDFLRNVAEKNWSMFRQLPEEEYQAGLHSLHRDRGQWFESPAAGTTLLWMRQSGSGSVRSAALW